MITEIPEAQMQSRRSTRRHFRGYRRLKTILLSLGLTGLAVGLVLLGWSVVCNNMKLCYIGFFYLLASMVVLGTRGIIAYQGQLRNDGQQR